MTSIKEFLKPEYKGQSQRNMRIVYLFGFFFVFLIGFIGGLYIFKSILMGFLFGIIVSLPFLVTAIPIYIISSIGINKNWSKKSWTIFLILMILIGLVGLLWNLTR